MGRNSETSIAKEISKIYELNSKPINRIYTGINGFVASCS